jgi:hypothetical protein
MAGAEPNRPPGFPDRDPGFPAGPSAFPDRPSGLPGCPRNRPVSHPHRPGAGIPGLRASALSRLRQVGFVPEQRRGQFDQGQHVLPVTRAELGPGGFPQAFFESHALGEFFDLLGQGR